MTDANREVVLQTILPELLEIKGQMGEVIATLKRVEDQTTITNGRVTALEKVNIAELAEKAALGAVKQKNTGIWNTVWSLVGALIGAIAVLWSSHK